MRPLALFLCAVFAGALAGADFPGWQGLRVVKADYGARNLLPLHLDDGETALLLVNTRQSRFEIFRHTGKTEAALERSDFEDPNFLPFAPDFERTTVPLARLPLQATTSDLDDDGIDEIIYVHEDPATLVVLKQSGESWKPTRSWTVAEAKLSTPEPIRVREGKDGKQIFLSYETGIQIIRDLGDDAVTWLQPRERESERNHWWFSDLDGDGDLDLVEATNSTRAPLRWYQAEGDRFRPAVNISEDINKTNLARLLHTPAGDRITFLGANQANSISLYALGEGEASKFGRRSLLPLLRHGRDDWASLELDGAPALLELGEDKPVLNLYRQVDGFWQFHHAYPALSDVLAIKALRDASNRVLLRVKDAPQLLASHWDGSRFTFPKPLGGRADDTVGWQIIGFGQDGAETWWITRRAEELVLSVLAPDAEAPRELVFPEVKGDYEEGLWLGGEALLVKKKFSKSTELCRLVEGVAELRPARLEADDLPHLQRFDGTFFLLREGVVQKLDDDLQVVDQIMLEGDQSIRSFTQVEPGHIHALSDDGRQLHEMVEDEAGIYATVDTFRVPFNLAVAADPLLGLTLISDNHINVPAAGSPRQLELKTKIDPNEIAPRDREEGTVSSLFVVDLDGDGTDEIAAVDYGRRFITVYRVEDDSISEVIAWKVFEDQKYPYGRDSGNSTNINPYRILAFDFDADGLQDLILASHDRLLFYLARDAS